MKVKAEANSTGPVLERNGHRLRPVVGAGGGASASPPLLEEAHALAATVGPPEVAAAGGRVATVAGPMVAVAAPTDARAPENVDQRRTSETTSPNTSLSLYPRPLFWTIMEVTAK